jgi:hypothetical protein
MGILNPGERTVGKVTTAWVLVTPIMSSNRSAAEQYSGAWISSGAVRISVAHGRRNCLYLQAATRQRPNFKDQPRPQVVEVGDLLEHPLFAELNVCQKCWAAEG